ncbi:MAG: hypothetical protein WC010_01735 [Candidatus Absconditabacterales bacterium]
MKNILIITAMVLLVSNIFAQDVFKQQKANKKITSIKSFTVNSDISIEYQENTPTNSVVACINNTKHDMCFNLPKQYRYFINLDVINQISVSGFGIKISF